MSIQKGLLVKLCSSDGFDNLDDADLTLHAFEAVAETVYCSLRMSGVDIIIN